MTNSSPNTCPYCYNPVTEHAYECIGEAAWHDQPATQVDASLGSAEQLATELIAISEHAISEYGDDSNVDFLATLLEMRRNRS